MREIILVIVIILFVVAYFKVSYSIDEKKPSSFLWAGLMLLLFGYCVMGNFVLLKVQTNLEEELKEARKGLPEYEEIKGVYIIKKK